MDEAIELRGDRTWNKSKDKFLSDLRELAQSVDPLVAIADPAGDSVIIFEGDSARYLLDNGVTGMGRGVFSVRWGDER